MNFLCRMGKHKFKKMDWGFMSRNLQHRRRYSTADTYFVGKECKWCEMMVFEKIKKGKK